MPTSEPLIALLIDADNAPASKIELVFNRLGYLGTLRVRRAYGNWKKDHLQGWAKILHKYAITPIQQFDYVTGKNATDIALAIDAMDLLQTMRPEIFGIVAGDSDYTPLVVRLIASGSQVFGFGRLNTASIVFREACTEFISLGGAEANSKAIAEDKDNTVTPKSPLVTNPGAIVPVPLLEVGSAPTNGTNNKPKAVFIEAVQQHQQKTGWADVKSIGAYLSQRKIVKASYKVDRWASYYKKFSDLFEVSEQNGKTAVRLISER